MTGIAEGIREADEMACSLITQVVVGIGKVAKTGKHPFVKACFSSALL
jgi:hypothetical protein